MPTIVSVANISDLYSALSAAVGGEIIELAGGDYGDFNLSAKSGFSLEFPSDVTIISADPEDPAVFSSLDVRDTSNLTFDSITFDYTFETGDEIYYRPFDITGSDNITIRNSTFDGDLAEGVSDISDGYGYAIGLSFRDSQNITVENNEFFEFYRAAVFSEIENVAVTGNDIHSIRMDGLNFSQIDGALIESNYIHDFIGSENSSDHRDFIQFWTNGTDSPSTDITITGNHLDIGEGSYTQSIFMRNDLVDRGLAGEEMFYQNITITENTIVNAHAHGITVGETAGLTISNNTVLHADGDTVDGTDASVEIPKINLAETSTNVVVENNITADIIGHEDQEDWSVSSNAFVQDQDSSAAGYYNDVFVTSSLTPVEGVHQFSVLDSGMLATLEAGATATHSSAQDQGLSVQFHITPDAEDVATYHFDASMSLLDDADLPAGAEYLWAFGDGSSASGLQTSHTFPEGAAYDISLTVTLPDGTSVSNELVLDLGDTTLVSMQSDVGTQTALSDLDEIDLGDTGASLTIERENVAGLLGQDNFRISLSISSGTTQSAGELMRLHGSLITSVEEDGDLFLRLFQDNGEELRISTQGVDFSDTKSHDIEIVLEAGILNISADGEVISSTEMSGTLASSGNHDWSFGNPFGQQNFDGTLTAFEVAVNEAYFDETFSMISADPFFEVSLELPETDDVFSDVAEVVSEFDTLLKTSEIQNLSDNVITLGGEGVSETVERDQVDHILGEDTFALSFSLSASSTESAGEVMRLHQSFVLSVTDDGELNTLVFDEDGNRTSLTTSGANLTDVATHDITIYYEDNQLDVYVDQTLLSSAEVENPLGDNGAHDLVFGNPWGNRSNFDGTVSQLQISSEEEHYSMDADQVESSENALISTQDTLLSYDVAEPILQIDPFETALVVQSVSFIE